MTRKPVENPVKEVLATGQAVALANHTLLISRDRREFPIDDSAAPIKDEQGRVAGVIVVFRDVTEKRRADLANERLAAIIESSDDIIASKDLDGVLTSWNRGAERILGYTADEVVGKHVSMLVPPEAAEDTERILSRIRRGERVDHYHTKRRRKDGIVIDVSLTVSPIRNAEGEIVGASKVGRDVTYQAKAQELNERLAAIIESSDDIIASKDLDGVLTSWNRGAERILGYTADEVIGKHVSMLMPPELVEDMPTNPRADPPRRAGGPLPDEAAAEGRDHHRRLADRLPHPGRVGPDHRRLEDRPRHHAGEAGPRRARAAAGGGRGREGRCGGRQSPEGRVPRHPLARAAGPRSTPSSAGRGSSAPARWTSRT